ncbi:hypothetical protein Scep_025373 [Stephania cephalantha]|uniref:WD repeat-containing protein 44 n=1 Tax=Stephania cephalantha TaxID=152367 RepID=A0AAP0EIK4_9MAGN
MRSWCSEEEDDDDGFFDAREEITSVSDLSSECQENWDFNSSPDDVNWVSGRLHYDVWIKSPVSVEERRCRFFELMGIGRGCWSEGEDSSYLSVEDLSSVEINRITQKSEAVLGNSDFEDNFSSSLSLRPRCANVACDAEKDRLLEGKSSCRIKNLDDGTEFVVDQLDEDGTLSRLREVSSGRLVSVEEFQQVLGLSPFVQKVMRREVETFNISSDAVKKVKSRWLKRLNAVGCIAAREGDDKELRPNFMKRISAVQNERVRVRPSRKRSKEFSALFMGQDIQAHDGAILTMKFSPNGQYLASAGEDAIVRVWQVLESDRSIEGDTPDADPSCIYFMANNSSALTPLFKDSEKNGKIKGLRRMAESACVILPPKVFQISDKPLHEFHGHGGEIWDLSWSSNKHLLSASGDKTVRLWRVGCDQCLKVFYHTDYVTCIQFNPVDENYFISGSIDGKVRIWDIPGCHVVDWTDIKDIVTAVCYRPDGQGGIVGSMSGCCYFYDLSDNQLQLTSHISLQGKKKYPGRKITGLQFSPSEPSKLMVTSSDSQIRILDGIKVIRKYRGFRNAGSQISASFTSDGKHILTASEDSNVYIWNWSSKDLPSTSQAKNIWSYERFYSSNVSVAIPWSGARSGNYNVSILSAGYPFHERTAFSPGFGLENGWQHWHLDKNRRKTLPLPSRDFLFLKNGLSLDAFPKGSATWPEEKLRTSSLMTSSSSICKSRCKFLKSACQSLYSCPHAWGQVIVTAGRDGRIRSFCNYGLPIRS